MVGSPVPLKGFHYDRETMMLEGIAHDDHLVSPIVTFSQTHYIGCIIWKRKGSYAYTG